MTVEELISALSYFPKESTVVIDDADTGWPLDVKAIYAKTKFSEGEISSSTFVVVQSSGYDSINEDCPDLDINW